MLTKDDGSIRRLRHRKIVEYWILAYRNSAKRGKWLRKWQRLIDQTEDRGPAEIIPFRQRQGRPL